MGKLLSVLLVLLWAAVVPVGVSGAGSTPEQEAAQLQLRLQTREGRQDLIRDHERLLRMMEQPECRRELVRNREMVREMLQDPGVRAGIREYEPMIREMERNREARQEMGIYKDLRGEACRKCPGSAGHGAAGGKRGDGDGL